MNNKDFLDKILSKISKRYEDNPNKAHLEYAQWRTEAMAEYRASKQGQRGGSATKKKQWAVGLAKELAADFGSFPAAWEELERRSQDVGVYADHELFMDDGKLMAADEKTGKLSELSRDGFRTGYFISAKKAL